MSQNNTIWEYNGISFEFDIFDVENAELYEKTFDEWGQKEKELPKDGKQSEIMIAHCKWFSSLFDELLGEGTGEKLSGGKKNVRIWYEIYFSFLDFIAAQKDEQVNRTQSVSGRYSNRASRRAAERAKK